MKPLAVLCLNMSMSSQDCPSCESKGRCNGAELELADMEHELAVDCKDSEFGEDDMSCGLARSCDSCTQ